jgi:hypothetical protein
MDRKNIKIGKITFEPNNNYASPGTYKNIHGQVVKIDPKSLDPNTEVMHF